jgi:hypothetical protein
MEFFEAHVRFTTTTNILTEETKGQYDSDLALTALAYRLWGSKARGIPNQFINSK